MSKIYNNDFLDASLPTNMDGLDYLFHPASIALVGISRDPNSSINEMFLRPLLEFGFKGQLYPVNPRGGEIMGLKIYSGIEDIPDPVDYVIAIVPAQYSLKLVQECIAKGVKAITFYTAGFSETNEGIGMALEEEITKVAHQGGIRIIGPNCMGIYCPECGLSFWPDFPKESGNVACLCQSGGNSIHITWLGAPRGVRFSKVISYGNASDLDESDLIEYFTHDPDTDIIAAYIEGVKDGRRFIKVLGEAARVKPVIMLKAGCSESGARAVASHTGAMGGSNVTWEALCKQLGVIRVYSMEELADMIVGFSFLPPLTGRNAAIVTVGGGVSVLAADECERYGLSVPPLQHKIKDQLLEFTPKVGNILKNPIDSQIMFWDPGQFIKTINIVSDWEEIDFIIIPLIGGVPSPSGYLMAYNLLAETISEWNAPSIKPIAVVIPTGITPEVSHSAFSAQQQFASAGIPVFPTVGRLANSINKFIEYHNFK